MQRSIFIICCSIIINLSCRSISFAQSLEDIVRLADEKFKQEAFLDAADYYNRVAFFDHTNSYPTVYERLGDCFASLGHYQRAAENYELAFLSLTDDSLKREVLFKKATSHLLQQKFRYALMELYSFEDSLSVYFSMKKNLYYAVTYWGLENYAESEIYFLKLAADEPGRQEIKKLFSLNAKADKLNPKRAKILSMFLPGLGQFYSGDIKNGINSLAITALFSSLYIATAINFSLIEGYLIVFPWFQRYYSGGFKKAETIAINRKANKKALIFQQLLTRIEKR